MRNMSKPRFRMHVAINVRNLEENLKFYRTFFGEEPTKVKENYAKFELNNPPSFLNECASV